MIKSGHLTSAIVRTLQSYSVNNPLMKLLKVHLHGWYAHIIFHESKKKNKNKKDMDGRLGDLRGHGM
jgi:hypothetical protein